MLVEPSQIAQARLQNGQFLLAPHSVESGFLAFGRETADVVLC